jgi:hypothetical protein
MCVVDADLYGLTEFHVFLLFFCLSYTTIKQALKAGNAAVDVQKAVVREGEG